MRHSNGLFFFKWINYRMLDPLQASSSHEWRNAPFGSLCYIGAYNYFLTLYSEPMTLLEFIFAFSVWLIFLLKMNMLTVTWGYSRYFQINCYMLMFLRFGWNVSHRVTVDTFRLIVICLCFYVPVETCH